MKFLLTSAGIKNDAIAEALAGLVGRPLTELSIIHIPTAANSGSDDKSWMIDNLVELQKRDFKSIDILDVAAVEAELWQPRLRAADIISVGGGDEQYIAKVFRKIGMKDFLLSLPDTKVYMGMSAGSMVTGHYVPYEVLRMVYPEESFEDLNEKPLGLCELTFIPHLNSKWFSHVNKDNLEKFRSQFEHVTYATDDETALAVVEGSVRVVGAGDYWRSDV